MENGADPNLQDSFGNTVLHMAVIANQTVSDGAIVSLYGVLYCVVQCLDSAAQSSADY